MRNLFDPFSKKDILIFGLITQNIREPFCIGDLEIYPAFDLESYLQGYDINDINSIIDSEAKYAQYRPTSSTQFPLFSPMADDICLIPFRLFKMGWLSAMTIVPITRSGGIEIRQEFNCSRYLFGQIWADSDHYEINDTEINSIQGIYQRLKTLPKGYLELSLRRFSRCYRYNQHSQYAGTSELDDYWVDLVIALESMTSKENESHIKENMARRISLLLAKNPSDREDIKQRVRKVYKQRCDIVHGNEKDETSESNYKERFEEAEALRELVRGTINSCIGLLTDPTISLNKPSGQRNMMADIIDDKYRV